MSGEGQEGWLEVEGGVRLRWARFEPEGDPTGSVVLLHGRTEYIEKYLPIIDALNLRGLSVWTFDWRGQGLSTRPLDNPHKGHAERFDDYLGDLSTFLTEIAPAHLRPGPRLLMGHSMGGHLGLRFLARRTGDFDLGVFTAPMMGVTGPVPQRALHAVARAMVALGKGGDYASGGDYSRAGEVFEGNRLTGDRAQFERMVGLVEEDPRLALGGLTWGWLKAALDSCARVWREHLARRVDAPVLLVCAGIEARVDNRATRAFAAQAPAVTLVTIPGARHELLMEAPWHLAAFWGAFDAFMQGRQPLRRSARRSPAPRAARGSGG